MNPRLSKIVLNRNAHCHDIHTCADIGSYVAELFLTTMQTRFHPASTGEAVLRDTQDPSPQTVC